MCSRPTSGGGCSQEGLHAGLQALGKQLLGPRQQGARHAAALRGVQQLAAPAPASAGPVAAPAHSRRGALGVPGPGVHRQDCQLQALAGAAGRRSGRTPPALAASASARPGRRGSALRCARARLLQEAGRRKAACRLALDRLPQPGVGLQEHDQRAAVRSCGTKDWCGLPPAPTAQQHASPAMMEALVADPRR